MTQILETERLFLRKFELIDAPFILDLLNTPTWLQFIGDKGVRNLIDAEKYLKNGSLKSYEENGFGFYLVGEKPTQKPIGMCGFIKRQELEDVDLGFAFLPDYIGKGFGYEIAKATLDYGKDVLKLRRIIAIVDPRNIPSNALLQKLGFVFDKSILFGEKKDLLNLYGI
jgi:[ribosomal protein S5]-alanine N-acetyltransferase